MRPVNEKEGARKIGFLVGEPGAYVAARCARALPNALVFVQPNGSSWEDPRRINYWIKKVLKTMPTKEVPAWKRDGDDHYRPFTFHSIRHSAATLIAKAGVPAHVVDELFGWSASRTAMRHHYAHVEDVDLLAAADALAAAPRGTHGGTKRGRGSKTR